MQAKEIVSKEKKNTKKNYHNHVKQIVDTFNGNNDSNSNNNDLRFIG